MDAATPSSVEKSTLNYSPPAINSGVIDRQAILEGEQKLLRLNLTIAELQDNFASLKVQQNVLKRQIENYKAVVSPIRKLPPEILQAIFIRCLPPMRNATMSSKEAPLLYGRICRHWRQIAYATPQLWSSIHIVVCLQRHRQPWLPSLEDISAWLRRSGALPLSISICFPPTPPSDHNMTQPYLDTIARFKSRWRSLYLFFPFCDWISTLGQFNATDLPLFEKLYISGPMEYLPDSSGNYMLQNFNALAGDNGILQAPNLHSLGIPISGVQTSQLAIRWENLTSLAILGDEPVFHIAHVGRTLSLCPNLVTCILRLHPSGPLWSTEEGMNLTNISLPNLRSISFIEGGAFGPAPYLLEYLYTPQLRHFSYEQNPDWDRLPPLHHSPPLFLDALEEFLRRLITPLEELHLMLEDITKVDVVGILQLMHGLRRLSLRHKPRYAHSSVPPDDIWAPQFYFQDDHLLSLISPRLQVGEAEYGGGGHDDLENTSQGLGDAPSPTCACPNLEVFHCVSAGFSEAVLLNFLRSRCPPNNTEQNVSLARLRTVSVAVTLPRDRQESEGTRDEINRLQAANPFSSLDVSFVSWTDLTPPAWRPMPFSLSNGLEMFGEKW